MGGAEGDLLEGGQGDDVLAGEGMSANEFADLGDERGILGPYDTDDVFIF